MPSTTHASRVLAVGAHPDDCELLCGGTLARLKSQGAEVTICAVARGDKGSRSGDVDALARLRRTEAERAAATIGARVECLDVPDGQILDSVELRLRMIELYRQAQPDLVLTHWHEDYHPDHRQTGWLVSDCSWLAASPGHGTASPALEAPVPVFYMDTLAGLGFEPTEYVDIGEFWPVKERMLLSHASQVGPMAQHGERDLIAAARDLARHRGHQCGVVMAEGFRPCLKWKRVRPYRLLP